MTKAISEQRDIVMRLSILLNEIAGHEDYYTEAKNNPVTNTNFLRQYHKNKMKSFADRYAALLTELVKASCEQTGFELKPITKPKNAVELSETYCS